MLPQSHYAGPGVAAQRVQLQRAMLLLPLGELKSLRAIHRMEWAGQHLEATPGTLAGSDALMLPVDLTPLLATGAAGELPFVFDVEITGSEAMQFLPLAGTTSVRLHSDWPHPDFQGAFLPIAKSADATGGFAAQWSVLQLNRAISQAWYGDSESATQFAAATFGARLMQPSTVYSSNERAVRYGILFIVITFLGFFGWEHVTSRLRLHAMQYLLVGLALAVFYLLLMALSEHLGFALAYIVAAAALVLLIGLYVAGISGRPRAAALVAGLLATSYGLLYVILQSEDYALLLGSMLVFASLAALMLTTRRLDWSRVGSSRSATANGD
jgi:inner membrane protein